MLLAPPGKCYVRPIDGAILERKHAQPPLGLAYIAGAVRNAGYDVEILDILLLDMPLQIKIFLFLHFFCAIDHLFLILNFVFFD